MKLTLISHFYNEEFLLPYWIKHYLDVVDHAILIDYKSNDSSIDIIRTLAPHWEIRPSKNEFFNTEDIDKEVMEIEATVPEWKTVLNTTEFILKPNLKAYLEEFDKTIPGFGAISTNGVWLVDTEETRGKVLDETKPLVNQRHHGFFEDERMPLRLHPIRETYLTSPGRSRLIHNKEHGQYWPGRHMTNVPNYRDPNLVLLWFAYSPFDFSKERKLQIYNKKSKEYIDALIKKKGEGYLEAMLSKTEEDLEMKLKHFQGMSYDLNDRAEYREAINSF